MERQGGMQAPGALWLKGVTDLPDNFLIQNN